MREWEIRIREIEAGWEADVWAGEKYMGGAYGVDLRDLMARVHQNLDEYEVNSRGRSNV